MCQLTWWQQQRHTDDRGHTFHSLLIKTAIRHLCLYVLSIQYLEINLFHTYFLSICCCLFGFLFRVLHLFCRPPSSVLATSAMRSYSDSNPGAFFTSGWFIWGGVNTAITFQYGLKLLVLHYLREVVSVRFHMSGSGPDALHLDVS